MGALTEEEFNKEKVRLLKQQEEVSSIESNSNGSQEKSAEENTAKTSKQEKQTDKKSKRPSWKVILLGCFVLYGSCYACLVDETEQVSTEKKNSSTTVVKQETKQDIPAEKIDEQKKEDEAKTLSFRDRLVQNWDEYVLKEDSPYRPIEQAAKDYFRLFIVKDIGVAQVSKFKFDFPTLDAVTPEQKKIVDTLIVYLEFDDVHGPNGLQNLLLIPSFLWAKKSLEVIKHDFKNIKNFQVFVTAPRKFFTGKYTFEYKKHDVANIIITEKLLNNINIEELQELEMEDPDLLEVEVYRLMQMFDKEAKYSFDVILYTKEQQNELLHVKKEIREEVRRLKRSKR